MFELIEVLVKDGDIHLRTEYNGEIVAFMRSRKKRFWDKDKREWIIPESEMENLIPIISKYEYKINYNKDEDITENNIPDWYNFKLQPFKHQIEGINYGLTHPKFLLADEQGCIDGDMVVKYNFCGATKTRTLKELYTAYSKSDNKEKFKVRCLKDGVFGLNEISNVLYSGKKEVFSVILEDGKFVNTTYDHEILTDTGYIPLNQLKVGDTVITNGTVVCCQCGTDKDVITNKKAKFYGYCRHCMYINRDGTKYKDDTIGKHIAGDGYVYMFGKPLRNHPRYTGSGLLEHVYIMEQFLGRSLKKDEQVHHINGNRSDNRIENLQVLTVAEHHAIHSKEKHLQKDFVHSSGSKVIVIPKQSKVVEIKKVGVKDTYDIVMKDPYRNFIANGVVVHNCGKTAQVINLACILKKQMNLKHVLIIACVNGLKYNWYEEVLKHSDESPYILGTRYRKNGKEYIGSREDRLEDLKKLGTDSDIDKHFFIITNIETLGYSKSEIFPLKTKKNGVQRFKKKTVFPIVQELQNKTKDGTIGFIAIDEIHRCKNPSNISGKAILSLSSDYMVAMTGTPIMNNAIDSYLPLSWLGYEKHSLHGFKKEHCILGNFHQIIGYKNLDDIQAKLDKCMIRRLKKDVLDLPEKIYINDYVEMSKSQAKLYEEVKNDITENIDQIKLSPNPLTLLIRLRQVTGNPLILSSSVKDNPKFDRMMEIIEDVVSNDGKAIVFSNWTDVLVPAYELAKSKNYNPAIYTGQNTKDREKEKDRFKNDKSCKVIFGTIGAMGTGLTLTEANTVIFLDEPWSRAIKDQCEDRVHRIGTKDSPNIITIMCRGTIDEKINSLVYRKGKLSDILIDKEEDIINNKKLLNYLLSIN